METIEYLEARSTTLSPAETAERIGVTQATLANMRWAGRGPQFLKIGSKVRYRLLDLAVYLDAQTRKSTSDKGPDA